MRKISDLFREDFYQELRTAKSNREAFDRTEKKYHDKGIKVYGSYDSFRISNRRKR